MKKMMTALNQTLAYFFTPNDSTDLAGTGSFSFTLSRDNFNLGSLKVLFWMGLATGALTLIDKI
jgi:hypothetical protein